jgi:hypothetical protein
VEGCSVVLAEKLITYVRRTPDFAYVVGIQIRVRVRVKYVKLQRNNYVPFTITPTHRTETAPNRNHWRRNDNVADDSDWYMMIPSPAVSA